MVIGRALEAGVHELRLIAAHRPRYNRRSRNPNATWWVTATAEAFPRLSVVPTPRDGALGPFRSQQARRFSLALGTRTRRSRSFILSERVALSRAVGSGLQHPYSSRFYPALRLQAQPLEH